LLSRHARVTQPGEVVNARRKEHDVKLKHIVGVVLTACLCAGSAVAEEYGEFVATAYDPSKLSETDMKVTAPIAEALEGLTAPEGWTVSGVERYTPESMYDKINGRSELYLSYGTTGMAYRQFAGAGGDFEIFLYDMTEPVRAYGVFGIERFEEGDALDIGEEGYRSRGDIFFRKGRFYATIATMGEGAELEKATEAVARALAERLEGGAEQEWTFPYLGKSDIVPGSLKYFHSDAMSLDFMPETFTAEIERGGQKVTLFMSKREGKEQASAALDRFAEYFTKYGSSMTWEKLDGYSYALCEMGGGFYEAAFAVGSYVGGVSGAEGKEAAVEALEYYLPLISG